MNNSKEKDFSGEELDNHIKKAWSSLAKPVDAEQLWRRIDSSTRASNQYVWKAVAALFVVALLATASIFYINADASAELVYVYNNTNIPKEIRLKDGSVIVLNRNSQISYEQQNQRSLTLKGEAYFEVARDKEHPFTVDAGEIKVSVLGTSFNVNAYQENSKVSVSLLEGKVKVTDGQQQVKYLNPGTELVYHKGDQKYNLHSFNPETALAWKSSLIICQDTGLNYLMRTLENYYGIHIQNKTDFSGCKITGEFRSDLELQEIMEIISFSHDIEFETTDQKDYSIKGELCR